MIFFLRPFQVYLTSRLSCMVLRSDFVFSDGVKNESKKRAISETNDGDEEIEITDEEAGSEAEYDEIFDNMPVIANEENEANSPMKNKKNSKTKKLKLKSPKLKDKSLKENSKKLKKNRGEKIA